MTAAIQAVKAMPGMICPVSVGAQRTDILVEPDHARALFERRRHFICPDLIHPAFLPVLLDHCARATYVRDDVDGLHARDIEAPQRVGMVVNLMFGRPSFLRWLEAATGSGPLIRCEGRLARTCANGRDHIDWHDDRLPARRLGFVLNLSDAPFAGGAFQLRRKGETGLLADFIHEQPGTAIIFDVDNRYEHRVLPISAGGPRRVFSGWFMAAAGGLPPLDVLH